MRFGEEGFSLIELLVAVTVLLVGILAAAAAFDASRRLSSVAERQTAMAHRAEQELERVASLPFEQVTLTAAPTASASASSPGFYVSNPPGSCPNSPGGGAPSYRPDHAPGGSVRTEPLAINGCSYGGAATTGGTVTPSSSWSDGTMSGSIYDYITYATDPVCAGGTICPAANDYKRITVVTTINGVAQPTAPALVSALLADPNGIPAGAPSNSNQNPIQSPNTRCQSGGGQAASCSTALVGTPLTYFLSDAPSSGSYSAPACGGNNLHLSLLSATLGPGTPDQLMSSPPIGACAVAPCFSLDHGCAASAPGVPLVPASNATSGTCAGPPADNTKTHVWVAPQIPAGTTLTLNGSGGMTAYLESTSGTEQMATICVGLYVIPGGLLGSLVGNLLAQPIGAAAQANVTASAGAPTPVSFNFDVGAARAISSTPGNLARIAVAIWVAASAGPSPTLAYDQAALSSQVTLMSS